jgi:DNA-binding SARP family transcriptional activator
LTEFRVLGPVEAAVEGRPVALPAGKPRALLALLLLNRNRVVATHELIDELWGEEPPETAAKALQGYVSQLRKALGADRVVTRQPGYLLRVDEGELDLDRFDALVAAARAAMAGGDTEAAARGLTEALALWRGPPLAEFETESFARSAAARLEDERLAAVEERVDAELALGRHAALVPELEQLVEREPYRERLRRQLMLALYRSGRQADALDAYRRAREVLVGELGIEPGRELQELEQAMLRQDESLDPVQPTIETVSRPRSRFRGRILLPLAVLALAAAAAAVAAVLLSGGGSSSSDRDLHSFTAKLENFLIQSRDGRREIAAAVSGTLRCTLATNAALQRVNAVQRNRQSLLQQMAALTVPADPEAMRSSDLLQQAIQASIAADWHYRDWLATRKGCGRPVGAADLHAAQLADRRATRVKREFLVAFNPLARRVGQEVWTAGEF